MLDGVISLLFILDFGYFEPKVYQRTTQTNFAFSNENFSTDEGADGNVMKIVIQTDAT